MFLNSNLQKPLVYSKEALGRVTKWLCGGLQIRIRGFKSLPALFFLIVFFILLFTTQQSQANLVINEVMYDPSINDNYYEWIELYNPTNKSINLTGWSISDNSGKDFIEGNSDNGNGTIIIPPESYALITDHGTKFYNNYSVSNNTVKLYIDDASIGNGLGNTGDKILLIDNQSKIIDCVEWIKDYSDVPGYPANAVKENCTLARINKYNDSSKDFFESITPTPGAKNKIIEEGKTKIFCNQSHFFINKNEDLVIKLKITNEGEFFDNITIKITQISEYWNAQIDHYNIRLEPNESHLVNITILPPQFDCLNFGKITFLAQSGKEINYSDEITLTFEINAPDLFIKKIKGYNEEGAETNNFYQGGIIRIKAFLKNQGKQNATNVNVDFYLDEIKSSCFIGSKHYDSVGKYQKYPSLKIDTHGFSNGKHKIIVIADENNIIDEFCEENNILFYQIEIINTYPEKNAQRLLITDVYYHSRPGLFNEYIGLYNPTNTTIDLSGWYFTNKPFEIKTKQQKIIFPNNTILKNYSKIILSEQNNTYFFETGKKPDFEYNYDTDTKIPQMIASSKFILSNNGGCLALKDSYNHTIDFIVYGNNSIQNAFWYGKAISFSGQGVVLRRSILENKKFVDTNSSNDWENFRKYKIGQSELSYKTLNFSGKITTFISPDCSYNAIKNELEKSNKSIYLNIYEFSNPYLCNLLIDALLRNVSVNILLEGSPVGGISQEEKYVLNRIINYGGNVRFIVNDESKKIFARYTFNHGKYLVIDNSTVIVESCNWVKTGIPIDSSYGNREWGIIVHSEEVAKYYLDVFMQDWDLNRCDIYSDDQVNLTISPDFYMDKTIFKGRYESIFEEKECIGNFSVTPVFSPDTSYKTICNLIDSANNSIFIEQLYIYKNWKDCINPFVERLINKSKSGVDVKIILNYNPVYEGTNDKNNLTRKYFEKYGIKVKFLFTNWSYFTNVHNKGVIVDNKSVLISSINWNENSVLNNREAGIIIQNEDVAEYYADVFFYDWNINSPKSLSKNEEVLFTEEEHKNTIYIVIIFTLTFALIARDWRKRQWT